MLDINLVGDLVTETLHDKVVEAIAVTRMSDTVATYSCTCRYWDSSSESIKRICLTFYEAEIIGHLDVGFDICDASIQMIGDDFKVVITDCSSGLQTLILCSKADVSECAL